MRKIILVSAIIGSLFSCKSSEKYVSHEAFLENQTLSAKEYILNQFQTHDIVLLSERHHKEVTQYDLIYDIASDPYFIENVGAIYTEVGTISISPKVNELLDSSGLDSIQLHNCVIDLYRNAEFDALFAAGSFPALLKKLYTLNQLNDKKVHVYPCDVAWKWNKCLTPEYMAHVDSTDMEVRDSIMAMNFISQYEQIQKPRNGRKKALIIMNTRHGYTRDTHHTDSVMRQNMGRFLKEKYKNNLASVLIVGLGHPNNWNEYTVLQNGKWDYYFESTKKTDVGFDIKDTPFGKDTFDLTPLGWTVDKFLYQDIFTGLVYYKKLDEQVIITSYPGLMSKDFEPEFRRRWRIMDLSSGDEPDENFIQEIIDFYYKVDTAKYDDLEKYRTKIDSWKNSANQ